MNTTEVDSTHKNLCKQKDSPSNANKYIFQQMELASCGTILESLTEH